MALEGDEREKERERERSRGCYRQHREKLRRFMSYSLLGDTPTWRERARALSGPATRSFCFQPPSSLLLPSTSASTPRGHRYVYRVANRCLLGAYSTVHGELCVCVCMCVCTTHRDVNVRCVGGDTLMTG